MKKILGLLLALGIVATAAAKVNFPYPQEKAYAHGIYQSGVSAKVKARFLDFYSALYKEQGDYARIGFDDVNYTVSEGIGYGMIMMVYFSDNTTSYQTQFDKLWAYYNKFLNGNGFMHWKIRGFDSVDQENGATDADEDVAFALAMAYYQFGDEKYKTAASSLIAKIRSYEFETSGLHKPGDMWNSERNPSYVSPAEYEVFKSFDNANFWSSAIAANYTLLKNNQNGSSGLPTDWSNDNGNPSRNTNYGYDAARAPWRWAWSYAWYGHSDASTLLSKLASWVNGKSSASELKIPMDYSGSTGSDNNSTAVGPLTCALMYNSSYATKLSSFTTSLLNMSGEIYFSAAMQVLTGLLISGNMQNFAAMTPGETSSSSVAGSSTSTTSGSSTVTSVIDDFEDGNNIANTNLEDYWYAFTDKEDKGASFFTNGKNEDGEFIVVSSDYANSSDYGVGITGIRLDQGSNENEPYVTIGLNVMDGLAGCKTFSYDYEGAAHNFKVVMEGDEEGALTGYAYHQSAEVALSSWGSTSISVSTGLQQPSWAKLKPDLDISKVIKVQWEVKGDKKGTQPSPNYLYIDNFACDGMSIVPVVVPDEESSASETTSSETVEVSSSSFENPTCEDGETASAGTLTMLCVEGEWTVVAASSSSATPAAGSAMIDDVEDGDGQAFTGGFWFAYTDVNDKGSSIITNSPDDDGGYVVVLPGTNGTENMVGLTGISLVQGSNKNEPYVSLGLNITEEDAANDFTSCTEISYDYMGAAHNFKAIMKGDAKGELTEYNRHASTQSSSTTWTTATLSWDNLKQAADWGTTVSLDKSLLTAFHWEVKGDKNGTQPSPNYLYIDNLQCKGMNIVPVTSSSSEEVVESSSSEESTTSECEDGQEIHVGSAALKCVEGKWTDISVGSSSSAGGSSSSEGGSSASTGAPGVIDDMEDGDNQAFSGGYWFVYNDANDKGQSSFGNALDGKDYVVVFDGTNGSNYMVGMKDVSLVQGGNENEPYVAMGVNITDEKKANNLASCTEISYDYIGAAHNFKAIMAGDETGGLTGYNRHSKVVSASTTWTKATIDWSALSQATGWGKTLTLDKTKITAFHWEIKGDKNGTQPSPNYLYVDNFTCTGLDVAALASSSSSSQPTSSSSYNPYLPTSSSSYDPWAIGAVQVRGGLKVSMSGSTLNVTVERAGLVKVNVFDMMGHAIESHVENLSAGTYGHSLANLSKGAYIVRVQQGSEQKVIRTQVR